MDIREIAPEFRIAVLSRNLDRGTMAKAVLAQLKYKVDLFLAEEEFWLAADSNSSHILVVDFEASQINMNDFLAKVQNAGLELEIIYWGSEKQLEIVKDFRPFGISDFVINHIDYFPHRLEWAVDQVASTLYQKMQNEFLVSESEKQRSLILQIEEQFEQQQRELKNYEEQVLGLSEALVEEPPTMGVGGLTSLISDFSTVTSNEELIDRCLLLVCPDQTIYFKSMLSIKSLMSVQKRGYEGQNISGVACQLTEDEFVNLESTLNQGVAPLSLKLLMEEGFGQSHFDIYPLYLRNQLEGVFVMSSSKGGFKKEELRERMSLFQLIYKSFNLEKRVDALEVQDFVTLLYNRTYFFKCLADELSRSRRLRHPLSVIKVAIDDFVEIENQLGEAGRDDLLKVVGSSVLKTSRVNDINCRTGFNEFAIVLPHCTKTGASLRAERLRRVIETLHWGAGRNPLSVSIGISEFPSLCSDVKSLDESSTRAMTFIADRGGNKICLYKAPEGHRPEFEYTEAN